MRCGRVERWTLAVLASCATARGQAIEWLSAGPGGAVPDGACYGTSVRSANGRWVAFNSMASNLVAGDLDTTGDSFLLDRLNGTLQLVSVHGAGQQSAAPTNATGLSEDGRWVLMLAFDLAPGPGDVPPDIYLHDALSNVTVEVTGASEASDVQNEPAQLSGDGRDEGFVRRALHGRGAVAARSAPADVAEAAAHLRFVAEVVEDHLPPATVRLRVADDEFELLPRVP